MKRAIAHVLAVWFLGWLLLGCRCPKPPPVIPKPPIVTVAPPIECFLPVRPSSPSMRVDALDDGRLAASQDLWADIVGYILKAEARMDAAEACLTAQAAQP